jgi:KAP family P-loop domain
MARMSGNETAWNNDALNRKEEASAVATYLVARSNARRNGELKNGFVLAINAEYGEGKSYFIRNLKEQLAAQHPVALIDAWTDDRMQQPFLAILDALENALEPLFDKSKTFKENAGKLFATAGTLLSGLAKGAAKKGLEKFAGAGAAGLVGDALDANVDVKVLENEKRQDAIEDIQEYVSTTTEHSIEEGISRVKELADGNAKSQLIEFRRKKLSALRLKIRLAQIVQMIEVTGENPKPPIFIFIDELDRCRPTYAIELHEEVKHLFDVAGIVFVLCIHKNQLLSSIRSVYGDDFEAEKYLDRFVDKTYQLARPTSLEFVERELKREPIANDKFYGDILKQSAALRIGHVFDHYGLSLREMERVIDMIRGCVFLTGDIKLDPIVLVLTILVELGKNSYTSHVSRDSNCVYSHTYRTRETYNGMVYTQVTGQANFKDVVTAIVQCMTWDRKTVIQEEKRDRGRLEHEYAYRQISQFYDQFEDGSVPSKTQGGICSDAIRKFMPFVENQAL